MTSSLTNRLRRAEWLVAGLGTGVAILLCCVFLSHAGGLWRDEINTLDTATASSLSEMVRLLEFESFPVLWPLLARGWIELFGSSDEALRFLGLAGTISLLAAVWFAAIRLGQRPPGVSVAFLAINPIVLRWGTSPRAWGVGAALAIISLVLVWEAMERTSIRSVSIACLASILSVQCVYQNAVFLNSIVFGAFAVALGERNVKRAAVPVVVGVTAAISLIPYAGIILRRSEWNALNATNPTVVDIGKKVLHVILNSGWIVFVLWLAVTIGAILIALVPVNSLRRPRSPRASYAAIVLAASAFLLALFYVVLGYPTAPWYYLGLVAFMAVCTEIAIAAVLDVPLTRITLMILTVTILVSGFNPTRRALQQPQTNLRSVAELLNSEAMHGDLVVAYPWFYAIPLDHYYHGSAILTTIPPLTDHKFHRYDLVKRHMELPNPMAPLLLQMRRTLESKHRVWMVGDITKIPSATPVAAPPLLKTGWSIYPYMEWWGFEAESFLSSHGVRRTQIPVERGGEDESVTVTVIKGWRC
jgi:hypothetical protein